MKLPALLVLARPKQWVKNGLVAAAPLAAGELFTEPVFAWTVLAFVVFSMAASSVYMVNDAIDVEADRAHPRKRSRPIASGAVAPLTAKMLAAALALLSIAIPSALGNFRLAAVIGGYLVLQACYLVWLKHEPVLDVACVAAGFLLRAIAGGAASGIPISKPFLIVVSFGALFMVVGKRYSELVSQDQRDGETRRTLAKYTPSYLRMLLAFSLAVTVTAYTMWAFERDASEGGEIAFAAISVIPFTLALLRYARDVDSAGAEAPEDAVFADPTLMLLGGIWALTFVGQIFHG